jgi:hypothetical protein
MFLRCKVRGKDGKQHRYWSVVENTRLAGGRVVQRHVLYLGEINDSRSWRWRRSSRAPEAWRRISRGKALIMSALPASRARHLIDGFPLRPTQRRNYRVLLRRPLRLSQTLGAPSPIAGLPTRSRQ